MNYRHFFSNCVGEGKKAAISKKENFFNYPESLLYCLYSNYQTCSSDIYPFINFGRCPICGASGPVSHTIRYCPHNKGQLYEEQAHITVLKQMRSSTGKKAAPPPGVVGGPIFANVPPSKRPPGKLQNYFEI